MHSSSLYSPYNKKFHKKSKKQAKTSLIYINSKKFNIFIPESPYKVINLFILAYKIQLSKNYSKITCFKII